VPPLTRWRGVLVLAALPLALLACSTQRGPVATPSALVTTSVGTPSAPVTTGVATPSAMAETPPRASGAPGGSTSTSKAVPSVPGVTVTRTGGLAGVMQVLAVAADGSWTFTDRRAGTSQQGKLTTAQHQDLGRLVTDPALAAESRHSPAPGSCADGFHYTITFGEMSVRYDQCGTAGKRPLTDQLLALVLDATPM
jgi:hypothetical protein